jgi:hypothetical protein
MIDRSFARMKAHQHGDHARNDMLRACEEQWKEGYLDGLNDAVKIATRWNTQLPHDSVPNLRTLMENEVKVLRKKLDEQ